MLGTAFFNEGFEVQDAPRYGAERRGAPIFAFVRADKSPIHERGVIPVPDLVMVADDTLVALPAAGVLQGLDAHAVLAINTTENQARWQERLNTDARLVTLPTFSAENPAERMYVSAVMAGAAARLCGAIREKALSDAIGTELTGHEASVIELNVEKALHAFEAMTEHNAMVRERALGAAQNPNWVTLGAENADVSAPNIHAGATSTLVKTGLWRTLRPVIDYDHCNKCNWVCGSFCPDGAINVTADGWPVIDYDHCKGCMVCVSQCPKHTIQAVAEAEAAKHPISEPPKSESQGDSS